MNRIDINGDALHDRARTMHTIVRDFSAIGTQADVAADAVGQSVLARTLDDFAGNWRVHRSRTVEALTGLADAFDAVNSTFNDLDTKLTTSLREATAELKSVVAEASASGEVTR